MSADVPVLDSADPPGLPRAGLRTWLATNLPEFDASDLPAATLLPGGRSNLTYAVVDAAGRRWVVRRPPLGHVMPSAHDLEREFTVLTGMTRAAFPVPRPWALCTDPSVIGSGFLVMDFVDGVVIADRQDATLLSPAQAGAVCEVLVAGLARLHALDANDIGLGAFGRPHGYLARQVRRWGQQWELSRTRSVAGVDVMGTWLADRVSDLPEDLPWSVVHGDYRLDNCILSDSCDALRAVLDWEMSTLGDPVADLAVALVYWTQADDSLRTQVPVAQQVTSGVGFWRRERIVDRYAELTGRDLDHLGFCLVLACYKLAVILESLHYRSLMGQQLGRMNDLGEDMGAAVEALAQLGERLVDAPDVQTLAS